MNSRPKPTDSEQEILEMQKNFFEEKAKKKTTFSPAAKVVKVQKQSLFAQSRKKDVEGNKKETNPLLPTEPKANFGKSAFGEIVEKKFESPKAIELNKIIICQNTGFPKAEKLISYNSVPGKSLFSLSMERKRHNHENISEKNSSCKNPKSYVDENNTRKCLQNDSTVESIHKENLKILNNMTEEDILTEKKKLLQSLDPKLIEFLQSKRKDLKEPDKSEQMDIDNSFRNDDNFTVQTVLAIKPVAEIISQNEDENWLNFHVIEKEKLEWMKDIPLKTTLLKPGEAFEARFDWKGVLLPYTETDSTKDNKELYLHGDEEFRPGYTLQELFRLARSNIIQQRISAFSAISGIINIYNQGFYDNVLELPITKIFFLCRIGFDENSLAILEVVANGLSTLFYNSSDEILLDLINETREGFLQPLMEFTDESKGDKSNDETIVKGMKDLNLTTSPFSAKIQEDESESKMSMSDFELAETNLVDCLLRTNIIQRISFILEKIKPENSTVFSCLKILISIARSSKNAALNISTNNNLLRTLFDRFLPGLERTDLKTNEKIYNFPQYLVLKLFRILISQNISFYDQLVSMDFIDKIKNYLHTIDDINSKIIKVQIESLRIVRSIMCLKSDGKLFKSLIPSFRYMLEWHGQHLNYGKDGPFLIRQHAAALLFAISSEKTNEAIPILKESIQKCCSKWFHEAKKHGIQEFSQSILLSSCLNCVVCSTQYGEKGFKEFIEKYLKEFVESKSFLEFAQNLSVSSIILKKGKDRRYTHHPLPNLGSVLIESNSPQLIISQLYTVYFLNILFRLIEKLKEQYHELFIDSLKQVQIFEPFIKYLKNISKYVNKKLATNYLTKPELQFVCKIICFDDFYKFLTKEEIMQASFNILSCMSSEFIPEIENIFEKIVFNKQNLEFDQTTLNNWKDIHLETLIYPHRFSIPLSKMCLTVPIFSETLLPTDWPYSLLKSLLYKYLQPITEKIHEESEVSEKEVVKITLTFTQLLEEQGLQVTSPTEKLMYLMMVFMGTDLVFLEPNMKELLFKHIKHFYKVNANYQFNFDGEFKGKSKFENFYVLFLDHFQSASYGDSLFSSLVMLPLAQKYDPKWRKMVWSEHVAVLKFLNCNENELLGSLTEYLEPIETDISLIKCYANALNCNLLREDSIPYKIAMHHLNYHKKIASTTKKN